MGHSPGKTGTTSKEEYLKEPRHVSLYLQSDFKSVLYLKPAKLFSLTGHYSLSIYNHIFFWQKKKCNTLRELQFFCRKHSLCQIR